MRDAEEFIQGMSAQLGADLAFTYLQSMNQIDGSGSEDCRFKECMCPMSVADQSPSDLSQPTGLRDRDNGNTAWSARRQNKKHQKRRFHEKDTLPVHSLSYISNNTVWLRDDRRGEGHVRSNNH
jgi:hypothetical protein